MLLGMSFGALFALLFFRAFGIDWNYYDPPLFALACAVFLRIMAKLSPLPAIEASKKWMVHGTLSAFLVAIVCLWLTGSSLLLALGPMAAFLLLTFFSDVFRADPEAISH